MHMHIYITLTYLCIYAFYIYIYVPMHFTQPMYLFSLLVYVPMYSLFLPPSGFFPFSLSFFLFFLSFFFVIFVFCFLPLFLFLLHTRADVTGLLLFASLAASRYPYSTPTTFPPGPSVPALIKNPKP